MVTDIIHLEEILATTLMIARTKTQMTTTTITTEDNADAIDEEETNQQRYLANSHNLHYHIGLYNSASGGQLRTHKTKY